MSQTTLAETLVPVTTEEADQQAALEYTAELQAGLSDVLYAVSSSRVRAAKIDAREVGSLRMAAYSAPSYDGYRSSRPAYRVNASRTRAFGKKDCKRHR